MKAPKRTICLALLLCGSCLFIFLGGTLSFATNLGRFGATYPIEEKDAYRELKLKAASVDLTKHINKKKLANQVEKFRPSDIAQVKDIPPAHKDASYLVDMTYTLAHDIPDGQGGILYPAGYSFNPLDYIMYPNTLVIINGLSPKQLVWFRNCEHFKDYRVKLLITDGSYRELARSLKRPVYYTSKKIVDVFQVKAVPSVIRQKGNMMEVTEVYVGNKEYR